MTSISKHGLQCTYIPISKSPNFDIEAIYLTLMIQGPILDFNIEFLDFNTDVSYFIEDIEVLDFDIEALQY